MSVAASECRRNLAKNSRFSSRGNLTSSTDKMHGPIEAHPLNTLDGTVQLDDKEANPPATSFPVDIPANLPLYIQKQFLLQQQFFPCLF